MVVERSDIFEAESADEGVDEPAPIPCSEIILLCEKLEKACIVRFVLKPL